MARSPFPSGAPIGRIDQGIDYSGSFVGPIYAVGNGTVYKVDPVGTSSWGGMGAIYYKLDNPITVNGRTYNEVYTAETSDIGVREGQRIQQGQVIATTKSGWQETGFARNGAPIAADVKMNGTTAPTQAGHDFLDAFNLHSSAASAGNADPNDAPSTATAASNPAGVGGLAFTPHQMAFINRLASDTGLPKAVVAAQVYNEENVNAGAPAYESRNYNNWLNIGNTEAAVASGALNSANVWADPVRAADATAAWMQGNTKAGYGTASSGIQDWYRQATAPGATPQSIISGLQRSGWASGGYPNLPGLYQKASGGTYVTGVSGSTGANGGTKSTGSMVSSTAVPPRPSGGGLYGPPAPTGSASYGPPVPGGRTLASASQGTKTTSPVSAALLNLLRTTSAKPAPILNTAANIKLAPVPAATGGLTPTDLSPFTIAPLNPATATTPVPVTPNAFQIFGLRP